MPWLVCGCCLFCWFCWVGCWFLSLGKFDLNHRLIPVVDRPCLALVRQCRKKKSSFLGVFPGCFGWVLVVVFCVCVVLKTPCFLLSPILQTCGNNQSKTKRFDDRQGKPSAPQAPEMTRSHQLHCSEQQHELQELFNVGKRLTTYPGHKSQWVLSKSALRQGVTSVVEQQTLFLRNECPR